MARNSVADLQRDISAKSNTKNTYASSLNKDGTLTIQKNGANVHKIFYVGAPGAVTDANPQGDRMVVISPDGHVGIADVSVYLNSLS